MFKTVILAVLCIAATAVQDESPTPSAPSPQSAPAVPSPPLTTDPPPQSAPVDPSLPTVTPSARLPLSLSPTHYTIELEPRLQEPWDIKGRVNITIVVRAATHNITLNMLDIITLNHTAKVTTVTDGIARDVSIIRQTYDVYRQMYTAELAETLDAGTRCNFFVEFKGLLNDKLVGFYRSSYTAQDGTKRWMGSSQFSPTDARRAFPGFDEPGFKSTFDITLVHTDNLTAHSNMPVLKVQQRADGLLASTFQTTPIMSTFIVMFHISDLVSKPILSLPTTNFTVWTRPNFLGNANFSYEITPKLLAYLEDYFGIAYFLPKLHMAAIPDFKFRAMENWGFITFREASMLTEGASTHPNRLFNIAYIISHELTHQWFGNLVTPSWWAELWLKEGFATFMGNFALDQIGESWHSNELFVISELQTALELDSLATSHAINVPVNHPDQISEVFDAISYSKGASVLRMVYHFIGPEDFKQGLRTYLNKLKFTSANQDDLWHHLTEAGNTSLPKGVDVKTIMDTWTYKKGYPMITVTVENGTMHLSQEQFLFGSVNKTAAWWVPVSYTTAIAPQFNDTRPNLWMTNNASKVYTIETKGSQNDWVLVNLLNAGFYRVNYDNHNWGLLADQLSADQTAIPAAQRAVLISDAFSFARAGRLDYSIPLELIKYLVKEDHFVPFKAAINSLKFIHKLLRRDQIFGKLQSFMLSLIRPWYDTLGFEDDPADSFSVRSARAVAVWYACTLGHDGCRTTAQQLFDSWIADTNNSVTIPSLVRHVVLCTGVASGSVHTWDKLWEKFQESSLPLEKDDILAGLACSKEPWLLHRYLNISFTDGSPIRKHNSNTVFRSVVGNPAGTDLAWRYIRTNWPNIVQYLGSNNRGLANLFEKAKDYFNSDLHVQEVKSFAESQQGSLAAAERAVQQAIEAAEANARWMKNNYDVISNWLERYTSVAQ